MSIEVIPLDLLVLELVVVEILQESLDLHCLEETHHLDMVPHEDLAVAGDAGDEGFPDVVRVPRL